VAAGPVKRLNEELAPTTLHDEGSSFEQPTLLEALLPLSTQRARAEY